MVYIFQLIKKLKIQSIISNKFKVIGSAHNIREIDIKKKQGCTNIFFQDCLKQIMPIKMVI